MLNKGARVVTILVSYFLFLVSAQGAFAQYGQYGAYGAYGPYGQGESNSILVDKMVGMNTVTSKGGQTTITYVDNLSSSDKRFKADQIVTFKVKVKNTSDHKLTGIVVRDILPSTLTPIDTFKGYNASNQIITLADDLQLNAGEEVVMIVKTRVVSQDKLPTDQGVICNANKASASNDKVADEDISQFCIEKDVIGVKTQPTAGPELGLGLLALQMLGLGSGIYLKKKSN